MTEHLPVPPELEFLIEKRKREDRRKAKQRRRGDRRHRELEPADEPGEGEDIRELPTADGRSESERRRKQGDRRQRARRQTDD